MQRVLFFTTICFLAVLVCSTMADKATSGLNENRSAERSSDWPWWRGPNRNGLADENQKPPRRWSETENVIWKSPVPGRGHGSPTVIGQQIILATADEDNDEQSVICFDRDSGKKVWSTIVHADGVSKKGNKKGSQASCTVACDGERIFVNFLNNKTAYTTALTRQGQPIWQKKITDYTIHQGYASSPAIYQSLVIVSADNKGGGAITALNRKTGEVVWKHQRPSKPNYPSPIIMTLAGRDQLILTGCDLICSYDPLSGKKLWETAGATTECVTSAVTDGKLVFTSGGYPRDHVSAVRADGSGEIVWNNGSRIYVPSMLVRNGHLYAVADAGVAMCWESSSGKERWKRRLGGTFSASPVMVGDLVYAANEEGTTFIYRATSKECELIAENQLGDEVFATPTICGGRVYTRVAKRQDDVRQEFLYCLGQTDTGQ